MKQVVLFFEGLYYSFPVQLLLTNLKRNQVLVLCWVVLFAMATGSIGKYLGIPYLFLDPEYLNKVNATSFMIIGIVIAGFVVAFHITCYISDGYRFAFIGTVPKPFTKFSINNSVIPLVFFITYLLQIIRFQIHNEYSTASQIAFNLLGFIGGFALMIALLYTYFWYTNKDIFRYVVCRIDEKLKEKVQVTRASAMRKLDIARKKQVRVDYYLDGLRLRRVEDTSFYDRATIIQVFDQNHFNLVVIEVFIFVVVVVLGIFKDYPVFQLPAAASFILFLTIFVMLAGAFSYWFGGWSITTGIGIFLIFNYLAGKDVFNKTYEAFGLDYRKPPASYTVAALKSLNDSVLIENDRAKIIPMLTNWRAKFGADKPKITFICVSGGGKRAAVWTLNALQHADSITGGNLMKNAVLITGASGGLIGASYYRELALQEATGNPVARNDRKHLNSISADNLNPLIFSLLANDLFVGLTRFEYNNIPYKKDRAYTFEMQLDRITEGYMDKPLKAYYEPEQKSLIPMMILSPTVVTDGRKLYISSQRVSFMNNDLSLIDNYANSKISGVDFQRLFAEQGAQDLRFLSALRMCATFPYITPTSTLPSEPPIEIMDAGISDNFGISDAVRFIAAFKDWINENTSGVVMLCIRDSPKLSRITERKNLNIIEQFSQPISSVYNNFENFQDITNDNLVSYANTWLDECIERIDIEYQAETYVSILNAMDSIRQNNARASLSWRLTTREKDGIVNNINTTSNTSELQRLADLLGTNR